MFVEINGRIWDYEDYRRRLVLMRHYLLNEVNEALAPYGFSQEENDFYNEELDLKIRMQFIVGKIKSA